MLSAMICALTAPATSYSVALPAHQAKSDISGVSLVALGALPHSPENGSRPEYCAGYRAQKLTAVGTMVAKLGWIVTSEAPLGRYEVVTFASGFTPGTSGMCFARNANIAVFDGASLVALAYSSHSAAFPLGVVEPLESGALLVWTDPPGFPVGELHDGNNGLRLTATAPERTFCNRRAVVPNVYGRPLGAARKILIAHGWRPWRSRERLYDRAAQLAKQGIIEAESCSGTGVGYCSFNYGGPAGVLRVITNGEWRPDVVSYSVACRAH